MEPPVSGSQLNNRVTVRIECCAHRCLSLHSFRQKIFEADLGMRSIHKLATNRREVYWKRFNRHIVTFAVEFRGVVFDDRDLSFGPGNDRLGVWAAIGKLGIE